MDLNNEMLFLEQKAGTYKNTNSTISEWSVDSYIKVYSRHIENGKNKRGLELGCSNGYSTQKLADIIGGGDLML